MNTHHSAPISAESDAGTRYVLSENFMLREIAGEALLIPLPASGLPGNAMITLNETSAFLLRSLSTPHAMNDLFSLAKEAYDDPDGTLEENIRAFVAMHVKTGVIRTL